MIAAALPYVMEPQPRSIAAEFPISRRATEIDFSKDGTWKFRQEVELDFGRLQVNSRDEAKKRWLKDGEFDRESSGTPYIQHERLSHLRDEVWLFRFKGQSNSPLVAGQAIEDELGVRATSFSCDRDGMKLLITSNRGAGSGFNLGVSPQPAPIVLEGDHGFEHTLTITTPGHVQVSAPGANQSNGNASSVDIQRLYKELGKDGWYLDVKFARVE